MSEQTLEQRFVAAWGGIKNPELDGVNPHYKNKYATLKSTIVVIREACRANGIAYMQRLERGEVGYSLKSSVTDGSESMAISEFPMETPPNPQSFGSNLTYTKRQQAQADWCITGEEDDDGNAAADAARDRRRANTPSDRKPASKCRTASAGAEKPADTDVSMKAAKARLWKACKEYAEKTGRDAEAVSSGVKERQDYAETPEFFAAVAEEFEAEL